MEEQDKNSTKLHEDMPNPQGYKWRKCSQCDEHMRPVKEVSEDNNLPWREKGAKYQCVKCEHNAYVADITSIGVAFFSAIFASGLIVYLLSSGLLSFIIYSFGGAFQWQFFAVVLILFVAIFSYGAWLNLTRGIILLRQRLKHPEIK